MAGIAFRLQKLIKSDSYADLIRGYLYSAVISAGPFLVVIFTIAFLRYVSHKHLSAVETNSYLAMIVYVYAFSMLGVSPFYYVVTRYLADQYFLKQLNAFTPTYLAVIQILFLLQGITCLLYLYPLDYDLGIKLVLYLLYLVVSGIWVAMLFLSAARDYMWIVWSYVAGAVVTMLASLYFGYEFGMTGFLTGFMLGQATCFILLSLQIFREFGYSTTYDFGFLFYFKKYANLLLVGIFYFLGIWVDKFIFWFSPQGERMSDGIHVFTDYDTAMFLAYVTVVPSMAFFLVQMETSFVQRYHAYYQAIRLRETFEMIRAEKGAMIDTLTKHFQKFVLFQGVISGTVILFILEISDLFFLNYSQIGIFRIGILGAFLQMGFMMVLNVMFYFDFQKDARNMTLIFLVSNIIFTLASYYLGERTFGFGFTAAAFVSLMASFFIMDNKLRDIDYWTFMKQPILVPKFKFEAEK